MATKKFKCNVCGYIHEGDAAPANCPVCGVPASEFTELKQEKKGLFSDKNGNAYIIMYSTVMVVVVAVLLAGADGYKPGTPAYADSLLHAHTGRGAAFNTAMAGAIKACGLDVTFITPSEYAK